jgi:hypothetical protein
MAKRWTLAGTVPASADRDGVGDYAGDLLADPYQTRIVVAVVTVSHGHRNYDKGEDEKPVLTVRQIEMARPGEEAKLASELLVQMHGRRTGQMVLPVEADIQLTPERLAELGAVSEDAEAG